ncbi:hypothetical protein [Rheinheimera sp.]|uniref:hypothetical protein n=1 Tax=Rheinheimera sp. TaxID=1869214 RepID=UPI004048CF93
MGEVKLSKLWIVGLVSLSVVVSSVLTQAYLMPGMTFLQRLELRKQYDDCVKQADAQRELRTR